MALTLRDEKPGGAIYECSMNNEAYRTEDPERVEQGGGDGGVGNALGCLVRFFYTRQCVRVEEDDLMKRERREGLVRRLNIGSEVS